MSQEFDRRQPVGPERDLERTISLMVDAPDEVCLDRYRQRGATSFKVRVAQEDLGKLIGRQGRTARALRALLALRGEVDDQRYTLEIRPS
jgi:predicted RNA-binding protein YlqC (UPF0109 family)